MKIHPAAVTHVVLDIEGTTCPVSFVAKTLFPYAAEHLQDFIEQNQFDPDIQNLLHELREEQCKSSQTRQDSTSPIDVSSLVTYAKQLIAADMKLTPLKDLQGRIWREGYATGELISPLFPDVAPCLHNWKRQGFVLAVYSSGSVAAQQQLYQFSNAGNLVNLFSHWFDTHQGPKQAFSSYQSICGAMAVSPDQVLFLSDSPNELQAARTAGLQTACCVRPGNPHPGDPQFACIQDFYELILTLKTP